MPPGCWILVLVWVWWLQQLMLVPAEEQPQQARVCPASSSCGSVTIADPFWLTDWKTERSCGPLDFKVDCTDNGITPVLLSSGHSGFQILDIAYGERSLLAVDLGKLRYLNGSGSCRFPSWNTSDMLGRPFRIKPVNLDLFLYSCTTAAAAAASRRDTAVKEMRCGNESNTFFRVGGYYDSSEDQEGYYKEGCNATVVPVMGWSPSGEANASDYMQLIRDGFLLAWDPPPRKFARPSNHLLGLD